MNISLAWGLIGFIIGIVLGILILYFTKVRFLLKKIKEMEFQSIIDTIYTDPE